MIEEVKTTTQWQLEMMFFQPPRPFKGEGRGEGLRIIFFLRITHPLWFRNKKFPVAKSPALAAIESPFLVMRLKINVKLCTSKENYINFTKICNLRYSNILKHTLTLTVPLFTMAI